MKRLNSNYFESREMYRTLSVEVYFIRLWVQEVQKDRLHGEAQTWLLLRAANRTDCLTIGTMRTCRPWRRWMSLVRRVRGWINELSHLRYKGQSDLANSVLARAPLVTHQDSARNKFLPVLYDLRTLSLHYSPARAIQNLVDGNI